MSRLRPLGLELFPFSIPTSRKIVLCRRRSFKPSTGPKPFNSRVPVRIYSNSEVFDYAVDVKKLFGIRCFNIGFPTSHTKDNEPLGKEERI